MQLSREEWEFLRNNSEPLEYECHLRFYADGRTFQLVVIDETSTVIDSADDLMFFNDTEEAMNKWVDLHENFNVAYTEEEMNVLGGADIPFDPNTGN
jgi:hypothetical protein